MPKLPECDRCQLYGHTLYLVCGVHPAGPDGDTCLDFAPHPEAEDDEWLVEVVSYYAGQPVPGFAREVPIEEKLRLLDWHPCFPGNVQRVGWNWICPGLRWSIGTTRSVSGRMSQCKVQKRY